MSDKFYKGQNVKIIANTCGHVHKIGTIVTLAYVKSVGEGGWDFKDTEGWLFDQDDCVPFDGENKNDEDKTVILMVYGDGDYGAITFENNFDSQKVYDEMVTEGIVEKDLIYNHPRYGEEELHCEIHEFGKVDERFFSFLVDNFIVNEDDLKATNIYFIKK